MNTKISLLGIVRGLLVAGALTVGVAACHSSGCPTDSLAGSIGHPCLCATFGGYYCNDANAECRSGTCEACGGPGEHCCANNCDTCTSGLHDDWDAARNQSICSACGEAGQRCCRSRWSSAGVCSGGSMCDLGTNNCVATSCEDERCCGTMSVPVPVIDPNGCATALVENVYPTDPSDAENARYCASLRIPAGYTTPEPGEVAEERDYCANPRFGAPYVMMITGYSQEDRDRCADSQCGAPNCEATEGECP